jgi:7-cyano-7-deazaguanine synthase in queuosine biosynthesis
MKLHLPNTKNISFLFSGGVDSTLLLYLALSEFDRNSETVLRAFGYYIKEDRVTKVLDPILAYLDQVFRYQIPLKIFNHKLFVRPTAEKVLGVYPGVVYTGCNKVVLLPNQPKNLTTPIRGPALNEFHLRPFINLSKVEIALLYKQYGIEDLFSMTYSCVQNDLKQCGYCYFCLERAWAAKIAGISDNHIF